MNINSSDTYKKEEEKNYAVVAVAGIIIALFLIAVLVVVMIMFLNLEKLSNKSIYNPNTKQYSFKINIYTLLLKFTYFNRLVSSSDVDVDKTELNFNQDDTLTKVDIDYEEKITITNKRFKCASCSVSIPENKRCLIQSIPKKFNLGKVII